jgi:hypothetical protein
MDQSLLSNSRSFRFTQSSKVSGLGFGAMSCLVRQTLAFDASQRDLGAVRIVIAKLGAGVLAEIEFGQVAVKVLVIDVLVHADNAAFEHTEKAFQRIGVNVAPRPLEFVVVNGFVRCKALEFEILAHVGNQAAIAVRHFAQMRADAAVIQRHRPDIATALNEAKDFGVVGAAPEACRTAGLARPRHFGFVRLNRLAFAAQRSSVGIRCHRKANTVAKVPRGFHAATQRPLKLARGVAFLRGAKQVDGLQPQAERQVAILENRTNAHRKLLTAGVALAQARTGALAVQPANLVARGLAMRAHRSVRPKLAFDVLESGFLVVKSDVGQNGLGHGEISYGHNTRS